MKTKGSADKGQQHKAKNKLKKKKTTSQRRLKEFIMFSQETQHRVTNFAFPTAKLHLRTKPFPPWAGIFGTASPDRVTWSSKEPELVSPTEPQVTHLGSPCWAATHSCSIQRSHCLTRAQDMWKSWGKGVCNSPAWEKFWSVLSLLTQDRRFYQGKVTSSPLQAVCNSYVSQMTADFLWVGLQKDFLKRQSIFLAKGFCSFIRDLWH